MSSSSGSNGGDVSEASASSSEGISAPFGGGGAASDSSSEGAKSGKISRASSRHGSRRGSASSGRPSMKASLPRVESSDDDSDDDRDVVDAAAVAWFGQDGFAAVVESSETAIADTTGSITTAKSLAAYVQQLVRIMMEVNYDGHKALYTVAQEIGEMVAGEVDHLTRVYRIFQQGIANGTLKEDVMNDDNGIDGANESWFAKGTEDTAPGFLWSCTDKGIDFATGRADEKLMNGINWYRAQRDGKDPYTSRRLPRYSKMDRLIFEKASITGIPSAANQLKARTSPPPPKGATPLYYGSEHYHQINPDNDDYSLRGYTLVNAIAFYRGLIGYVGQLHESGTAQQYAANMAMSAIKSTETGTKNLIDELLLAMCARNTKTTSQQKLMIIGGLGQTTEKIYFNGRTERMPAFNPDNKQRYGFVLGSRGYDTTGKSVKALKAKKAFGKNDFEGTVVSGANIESPTGVTVALNKAFSNAVNLKRGSPKQKKKANAAMLKLVRNDFADTGKKENREFLKTTYIQALMFRDGNGAMVSVFNGFAQYSIMIGFGNYINVAAIIAAYMSKPTKLFQSSLKPALLAYGSALILRA